MPQPEIPDGRRTNRFPVGEVNTFERRRIVRFYTLARWPHPFDGATVTASGGFRWFHGS